MSEELPGLERIRVKFLDMLEDRQASIAQHALRAWESDDKASRNNNLLSAQNILHQIAGTAGSLGFGPLGEAARACEHQIIDHIEAAVAPRQSLVDVMLSMDYFVSISRTLLNEKSRRKAS